MKFDWGTRTFVMGIINVTPDSFSGDGLAGQAKAATALAREMVSDGADIIDIGGMSSRPGHHEISVEEETARMMEVLPQIVAAVNVPVSIDTYRYAVAEAAVDSGCTDHQRHLGPEARAAAGRAGRRERRLAGADAQPGRHRLRADLVDRP